MRRWKNFYLCQQIRIILTVDNRIPLPLLERLSENTIPKTNEKEAELILDNLRTIFEFS